MKCDFAGPARAADDEDLVPVDPFQCPQRLLRLGGDHGPLGFPGVERLAGRQPGRAAAGPDRRLVAAGGLLGEQDLQDFGVFPALAGRGRDHLGRRAANIGQPQAAQESVELVGERWWGGGLTVIGWLRSAFGEFEQCVRELARLVCCPARSPRELGGRGRDRRSGSRDSAPAAASRQSTARRSIRQ